MEVRSEAKAFATTNTVLKAQLNKWILKVLRTVFAYWRISTVPVISTNEEADLNRLTNRQKSAEDVKKLETALSHGKTEKEPLQNAFREKTKQTDHINFLDCQFDTKLIKLRNELQNTNDKIVYTSVRKIVNVQYFSLSDTERIALRNYFSEIKSTTILKRYWSFDSFICEPIAKKNSENTDFERSYMSSI
ncbi:hypothetical protein CRE_19977 [Caenorhabditis remanei]|uniref:Uncharacterized protein n=1 Tax=Caenorhabditis remanei TaxID=31234 RepID=E3N8H0_CAERE|nr:hypothetical protein CRE_19977 [Caenorhabditis remanei]